MRIVALVADRGYQQMLVVNEGAKKPVNCKTGRRLTSLNMRRITPERGRTVWGNPRTNHQVRRFCGLDGC